MESDYTVEEFVERVGVNANGKPLFGDCVSYACAYDHVLDGDGIFCIFIPSREISDGPMHAAVKIGSKYYDARGEVQKDEMIMTQYQEMRSEYKEYIRENDIENLYSYVSDQCYLLDMSECVQFSNFNIDLYEDICDYCTSQINRIEKGNGLSPDVTESRGSDF